MGFHVIIPARYASKRLPGKVLLDIKGKPMLQHVYEQAKDSGAESVTIATDHKLVAEAAAGFNAPICMTSSAHTSGTERLSEAVEALDFEDDEIVVCVQADEPLIPPALILNLAEDLKEHSTVKVTTLCEPLRSADELFNPDVVKVILNHRGHAIYFSRAPIPWDREAFRDQDSRDKVELSQGYHRHIGLYAYRVGFLRKYMDWSPCALEKIEMAEQLRIIWNGGRIYVRILNKSCPGGVDNQEDLDRVRNLLKSKK